MSYTTQEHIRLWLVYLVLCATLVVPTISGHIIIFQNKGEVILTQECMYDTNDDMTKTYNEPDFTPGIDTLRLVSPLKYKIIGGECINLDSLRLIKQLFDVHISFIIDTNGIPIPGSIFTVPGSGQDASRISDTLESLIRTWQYSPIECARCSCVLYVHAYTTIPVCTVSYTILNYAENCTLATVDVGNLHCVEWNDGLE